MTTSNSHTSYAPDVANDIAWEYIYPSLRSLALRLVFYFHVPCWKGQEYDIAEDIVQETMSRLSEYARKVECGNAIPIRSLECLMRVIASNYCKDLRRRERRLLRINAENDGYEARAMTEDDIDPSEIAIGNVSQEELFTLMARKIASFPNKLRRALLIDLANRMHFDTEPTTLQEAFLKVGIQLQDYQQLLPDSQVERRNHVSLVCQAYKRITLLLREQEIILDL